jgi:hypothetical protein
MPRALVGNAANPEQVAFGTRREKSAADHRRALMATQLSTPEGREYVLTEQLEPLGVFDIHEGSMEFVFAANAVSNEGRRLWVRLATQHGDAFDLMLREGRARVTRSDREVDAAHTPSVTETMK